MPSLNELSTRAWMPPRANPAGRKNERCRLSLDCRTRRGPPSLRMRRRLEYDHDELNRPVGGWIGREDKPTPRRTDRAFRVAAWIAAPLAALMGLGWLLQVSTTDPTPTVLAIMCGLALTFGALAYGATRALGMIVVGAVGAAVDGPEWTVSWRLVRHDLRHGATWAALIEAVLFLAAAAMMVFSILDAVRHGSTYSALVAALLIALTWWPFARHRIRHGRWPG